MSKTKKLTEGGRLVTRAELQFFARAVDARIAQELGNLREELTRPAELALPPSEYLITVPTDSTDSEGAE